MRRCAGKFGLPDKKAVQGLLHRHEDEAVHRWWRWRTTRKLLLLDEATNGLDPVVRDEVIDLLLDFARDENHSILISSHIVSDLEKLCDTIAFPAQGQAAALRGKGRPAGGIRPVAWHGGAAGGIGYAGVRQAGQPLWRRGACAPGYNARRVELTPVSIEELFVLMVKGEDVQ